MLDQKCVKHRLSWQAERLCVCWRHWDASLQESTGCLPGSLLHRTPFHWQNKRLFLSAFDLRKKKSTEIRKRSAESREKMWAKPGCWEANNNNKDIQGQLSHSWKRAPNPSMSLPRLQPGTPSSTGGGWWMPVGGSGQKSHLWVGRGSFASLDHLLADYHMCPNSGKSERGYTDSCWKTSQERSKEERRKGIQRVTLDLIPQNLMTFLFCYEQQLPDKALQYPSTHSAPAECNTRALNRLLCYLPAHFLLQLPTKSFETV